MEEHEDARVMVIDDDHDVCVTLEECLSSLGLLVEGFTDPFAALRRVRKVFYNIIFLDVYLKEKSGLELLQEIHSISPISKVILITGYGSKELAIRAIRGGAFDFLEKPLDMDLLHFTLKRALSVQKMELDHNKALEDLRCAKKELLHHKSRLEKLNKQLTEANRALVTMERNMEITRKETERNMMWKIKSLIIPLVEELKENKQMKRYEAELVIILEYFRELTLGQGGDTKVVSSLSPSEMRVAYLVRSGVTSNEISRVLHISPSTVKTHRRNIRKKLNICNTNHNLKSYLKRRLHEQFSL
ncbi:MAG TPA: response regulator [Deltaproteobacteria bacterium]|nr:response regulator [Deltaproteobacteria bacterium]